MPSRPPTQRTPAPGRLILAALATGSGLGWWYWKRVQPAIDAETAARLRVRAA